MKTDFRIFVCLLPAVVLSGCKTLGEVETHYGGFYQFHFLFLA